MIALQSHSLGTILPVRAQPGARRNAILGHHDGALRVAVTQVPEKGKANKAIVEVLCRQLDLKKSQVELISGETASQKRFLLKGVTPEEVRQRLEGGG